MQKNDYLYHINKKQEIEILQSLKGDTYFADFFGSLDIDQMCENIKNDFGLEYCCQFYKKAEVLQNQVKEEQKKQTEIKQNFVKGVISDFDGRIPAEVYDRLVGATGVLFIINFKREQNYPLTEAEIDWLVKEVNK